MSVSNDKVPLEQRVREAALHVEEDVKKVVTYLNDEVVPEVRRNGSEALRFAAAELRKLAERMDAANRTGPSAPPPPPAKP